MARYKDFLDEILLSKGLADEAAKIAYLLELRPIARRLWRSYRNEEINVEYNNEDIQTVYLLRYFPYYLKIINHELNYLIIRNTLPRLQTATVNLSLFCSGPLPEACGVCTFLSDYNPNIQNLNINSFDLNANGWAYSRNIVQTILLNPVLPDCTKTINSLQYDLRIPISNEHLDIIRTSDLIVFQNCLNEITVNELTTIETSIGSILENMPENCCLVIIERQNYINVLNLLNNIIAMRTQYNCTLLTPGIRDIELSDSNLKRRILNTLCSNLFESYNPQPDGLVISPNVTYSSFVLKKNAL